MLTATEQFIFSMPSVEGREDANQNNPNGHITSNWLGAAQSWLEDGWLYKCFN